jgi:Calcineurin-like phosphoesterase
MSTRRQRPPAASTPLLERKGRVPATSQPRFTRRGCIRLCLLLAAIGFFYVVFIRVPTSSDSGKTPEHVEGQHVLRVVAVGDLHGDYDNALEVLQMADVVDANGSWTGNIDYFVQTGDIVDR